jgi:plasmid replication initiation protein
MRKFLSIIFKWIGKIGESLETPDHQKNSVEEEKNLILNESPQQNIEIEEKVIDESLLLKTRKNQDKTIKNTETTEIVSYPRDPIRDVIDLMEFPFLALSKDRINPIIYESSDKTKKIVISGHRGHFLASIYDWDIILVVAGKIQKFFNISSDVPSRKIIIPRHELLRALHKQDGKKERKDLEKSLARLQLTGIDTTVNNKNYKYRSGFGFVENWGYLERKNNREKMIISITLSEWLYELCCSQGALLKTDHSYFELSSGLKRFLYRTARKHVGNQKESWEFTIEKLYEKSGSESEFKVFKNKLKQAVLDNDIPDYSMKWIERNGKILVAFRDAPSQKIAELIEDFKDDEQVVIDVSKNENLH